MIMRTGSKLTAVITLAVVPLLLMAQNGPKGPGGKPDGGMRVSPDVVNFTKTASETTLTAKVDVHQPGPPGSGDKFTATATVTPTSPPVNWLSVTPLSGTAPATLTITATPGTLAPGLYSGKITVTPSVQGATPQVVNVTLRILTGPGGAQGVFVRPTSLTFKMVRGGANPAPQQLSVSSPVAGTSFAWSAVRAITTPAGGTWLQLPNPASGNGPGVINVSVIGTALAAGTFTGEITVTSGQLASKIPVTLEVKDQGSTETESELVISPRAFNFIVLPGASAPGPKILNIRHLPQTTTAWTATAPAACTWLLLNGAKTVNGVGTGTLSVSVNAAGVARGSQECDVKVTAGSASDTTRVFLRVVGPPNGTQGKAPAPNNSSIRITPGAAEFTTLNGIATPASIPVNITSQVSGLTFTAAAVTTNGTWLQLSSIGGAIPATLNLSVQAAGLNPGTYSGLVVIAINGSVHEQRSIPVVLRVMVPGGAEPPRLSLNPGAVTFQAVRGGANPAAAKVNVQAIGAASIPFQSTVSVLTGSGWLSATPALGTAPQQVQVNVNTANLAQGTYTGAVVFQPSGVTALPATLTVLVTVTPTAGASSISSKSPAAGTGASVTGVFLDPPAEFTATQNSPMSVRVQVFGADGLPLDDAAVTITASDGSGPIALENTTGGVYSGVFQSLAGGPLALTATVDQDSGSTLFAIGGDLNGSDQPAPVVFHGGVVNNANFTGDGTPVAPGSMLTVFGANLVPSTVVAGSFPLPHELAGTKVLVGGIEAPLLAVVSGDGDTPDQITFQLPFELADLTYAELVVNNNGVLSASEGLTIAPSVPALFTVNQAGSGTADAFHADYRPITPDDPARSGETILLVATGLGTVAPAAATGAPANASRITADIQAMIGGREAFVDYAGLMPGFAAVYQLNVRIPDGLNDGDAPVLVTVGGISAADGVTVHVAGRN